MKRRTFGQYLSSLAAFPLLSSCKNHRPSSALNEDHLVISTWNNQEANKIAVERLQSKPDDVVSAVESGINHVENDPDDISVGYGGAPDRTGKVSLDACIMDNHGNAGSVTYLREIKNAISVARGVMEHTPHVILSGKGAQDFAIKRGFLRESLLTEGSLEAYNKWLEKSEYKPEINVERHDTIGLLVRNKAGELSGGCSTSGLAYKMNGRVGDSPIIGSGLFVDNQIGAATATGLGEIILKGCSSFLVVELMRNGYTPEKACETALKRLVNKYDTSEAQVGLIAVNKRGEYGAFSIHPGFNFALTSSENSDVFEAKSLF